MPPELKTLPLAAGAVLTALGRSPRRSWLRRERLRQAVERAIEILVSMELHDAAQELIDRLDAIDGDCDFESGDEDCSAYAEDDDVPRRVMLPFGAGPTTDLFDLEPNIVGPHWEDNALVSKGFENMPLRMWRHGLKRERGQ